MEPNQRNLTDTNDQKTANPPAAGASNQTASWDLPQGPAREGQCVRVTIPALGSLADTKTFTVSLQDSADNTTFAAIEPAVSADVTGDGGDGSDATSFDLPIPQTAERYIRVNQAVEASGGDNTSATITYDIAQ